MQTKVPAEYFTPSDKELYVREEVYQLKVEGGNPVFDFTTPREIYVRSIWPGQKMPSRDKSPAIGNFWGKKDAGDVVLWEYQTDSNGNLILDQYGNPIKIEADDPLHPGTKTAQKWVVGGEEVVLSVPRDNYKIKQLLQWPCNASVSHINGLSTQACKPIFYFYDPIEAERNEDLKREMKERAVNYVSAIKDKALLAYAIFIGVVGECKPKRDAGGNMAYNPKDLRYHLEEYARNYPADFITRTKQNHYLEDEVLLAMANFHNVIKEQTDGFYFYPVNGKGMNIAATEAHVYQYLRANAQVRNEVLDRTGYRDFRDDKPIEIELQVVDGSVRGNNYDAAALERMKNRAQESLASESVQDPKIAAMEKQLAEMAALLKNAGIQAKKEEKELVSEAPKKGPGRPPKVKAQ